MDFSGSCNRRSSNQHVNNHGGGNQASAIRWQPGFNDAKTAIAGVHFKLESLLLYFIFVISVLKTTRTSRNVATLRHKNFLHDLLSFTAKVLHWYRSCDHDHLTKRVTLGSIFNSCNVWKTETDFGGLRNLLLACFTCQQQAGACCSPKQSGAAAACSASRALFWHWVGI